MGIDLGTLDVFPLMRIDLFKVSTRVCLSTHPQMMYALHSSLCLNKTQNEYLILCYSRGEEGLLAKGTNSQVYATFCDDCHLYHYKIKQVVR